MILPQISCMTMTAARRFARYFLMKRKIIRASAAGTVPSS
jgi:hypothetical protein